MKKSRDFQAIRDSMDLAFNNNHEIRRLLNGRGIELPWRVTLDFVNELEKRGYEISLKDTVL